MTRRKAILDAALDAFEATGATAIEEVRSRSGASIGSIYHHFGGKQGIESALYVEILRDYQAGVLQALGDASCAEAGTKALVRHHLGWVEDSPARARFLLQGGAARRNASEELADLNRNLSAAVEHWVGQRPAIRPLPFEVFYAVVFGPPQEVSRLWLGGRIPSLRALSQELSEAAWRAVRAD